MQMSFDAATWEAFKNIACANKISKDEYEELDYQRLSENVLKIKRKEKSD
jgi:hypothetical protein